MSIESLNPKLHGKRHLPALTSLRILAAIHVVLFHCAYHIVRLNMHHLMGVTLHSTPVVHWAMVILANATINILAAGGWSVSFFFVLSGFILFYNYGEDRKEPFSASRFWLARFARIYPVYILGMAVIFPFLYRGRLDDPAVVGHSFAGAGVLSGTLLQSWFWRYATFWNAPGWSMSAEAFFYALFPLLLFPLRKITSSTKLLGVMLLCWIISIAKGPILWAFLRHAWVAAGAPDDPSSIIAITDYNPLARLPEFVAGMALGRLFILRKRPALQGAKLALVGVITGFLGLCIAALGSDCPSFLAAAGGLTPIFALVIWTLTDEDSLPARILAWSPLVFLGEASYSVYILHVPLVHWFGYAVRRIWGFPDMPDMPDIPSSGFLLLYIVIMLAICSLVYRYLELPARDFIRRGFRRRPQPQPQAATPEVVVPSV